MRRRLNREIGVSLFFLGIAVIAFIQVEGLNRMSAVFPRTLAVILLVLSGILLVQSLVRPPEKKKGETLLASSRILPFLLILVLYAVLIAGLGFLIATILFAGVGTWYLCDRNKIRAIIGSILLGILFYALFRFVFLVPFPGI